jgi:hypothetical protein
MLWTSFTLRFDTIIPGFTNQQGSVMTISNWPKTEQPREKLRIRGATTLSDAELLAIFYGQEPMVKQLLILPVNY